MRRAWWPAAIVVVVCGGAACGGRETPLPAACQDGGCPPEITWNGYLGGGPRRDLDVLIVVDDTTVLSSEAESLAAGFLNVGKLLGMGGGLPRDFVPSAHVAVVSGSRPAAGSRAVECGIVAPGQFLVSDKCGRAPNTTRPFDETVACLSALGHESTAPFEPFASVKRALGPDGLADFHRPNASLMVFIVAGQDDASPVEVTDLVASLKSLVPDPNRVLVSVAGPPTSCPDGGTAVPAPRLLDLVHAFGANGLYETLCADNALVSALQLVAIWGGRYYSYACFPRVFDTDPNAAGLQPDCVATDFTSASGGDGKVETPLPDCEHGAPPCWTLTYTAGLCGGDGVTFEIDRGGDGCLQDVPSTLVSCRSCNGADDPGCKSY